MMSGMAKTMVAREYWLKRAEAGTGLPTPNFRTASRLSWRRTKHWRTWLDPNQMHHMYLPIVQVARLGQRVFWQTSVLTKQKKAKRYDPGHCRSAGGKLSSSTPFAAQATRELMKAKAMIHRAGFGVTRVDGSVSVAATAAASAAALRVRFRHAACPPFR